VLGGWGSVLGGWGISATPHWPM